MGFDRRFSKGAPRHLPGAPTFSRKYSFETHCSLLLRDTAAMSGVRHRSFPVERSGVLGALINAVWRDRGDRGRLRRSYPPVSINLHGGLFNLRGPLLVISPLGWAAFRYICWTCQVQLTDSVSCGWEAKILLRSGMWYLFFYVRRLLKSNIINYH